MKEKRIEDFDWVTAREHCSLGKVFEKLRLQVKEDVQIRNRFFHEGSRDVFDVVDNGDSFSVIKPSNPLHQKATFNISDGEISVRDRKGNLVCKATLTLNDDGECKVRIKGQEHELWQMRKMALEEVFFGN